MDLDAWLERLGISLHDAQVHRLTLDYPGRTACLDLEVWLPEYDVGEDVYRPGLLTFGGLEYCVIEPPDPRYRYFESGTLCIEADPIRDDDARYLAPRASTSFRCRLFVNEWNAFVVICAGTVEIRWLGEAHEGSARPG